MRVRRNGYKSPKKPHSGPVQASARHLAAELLRNPVRAVQPVMRLQSEILCSLWPRKGGPRSGPPNQHWLSPLCGSKRESCTRCGPARAVRAADRRISTGLVGSRSDPTLGRAERAKKDTANQARALPARGPQRAFSMSRSRATATQPALVSRSAAGGPPGKISRQSP
jgi:hypothetical protein